MTNRQENKLSMYLTVQQVTNFHSEAWQDFTPFKNQFSDFEGMIEKIMEIRLIQEGKITGVTKDKTEALNNSVEKAIIISRKLVAYASIIGNNKLKDRVSYSFSELIKSRDTIIINKLHVINEAASQNISELADYGISQENLDELQSLTNTFRAVVENPRQSITNRVRATKEIRAYFKETDSIVKNRMDNLIHHFKATSPVFWQQYKSARKIIDLGHRKKGERPVEENEQEQSADAQFTVVQIA